MKKKLMSLSLVLVMCLSLCVPAFAATERASTTSAATLQASESAVITSTVNGDYEYISIVDLENGTAQAVQKDLRTGEYLYGPEMQLNSTASEAANNSPTRANRASPTYHQDTFSNIEYDIWVGATTEWRLERPADDIRQHRFMTLQTARNISELYNFRDCVDTLNDYEFVLIGDVGMAVLNLITALSASYAAIQTFGTLTTAAAVEIANAVKSSYDVVVSMNTFVEYYNSAARAYFRAYDRSKVYNEE